MNLNDKYIIKEIISLEVKDKKTGAITGSFPVVDDSLQNNGFAETMFYILNEELSDKTSFERGDCDKYVK